MRRKLCLGIALALFVVSSGSAAAAPVDVASEHVAVRAFEIRCLRGRITDVPAARQLENAFVASIAANCPGVLTPIFRLPQGSLKPDTVLAFVNEIGSDLDVEINAASRGRLARMTKALSHLPWSSKRTKATITQFLEAQHRLFSLAPSNLCADANALAANPQVTPPGNPSMGGDCRECEPGFNRGERRIPENAWALRRRVGRAGVQGHCWPA